MHPAAASQEASRVPRKISKPFQVVLIVLDVVAALGLLLVFVMSQIFVLTWAGERSAANVATSLGQVSKWRQSLVSR